MELQEEITSFVDKELKDRSICHRLEKLISDDSLIRREYYVQKSVKDLLNKRFNCNNHRTFNQKNPPNISKD